MGGEHHGVDIAAGVAIHLELHPDALGSLRQIIEIAIGHFLMGATEARVVEADRFGFGDGALAVKASLRQRVGEIRSNGQTKKSSDSSVL